MWALTGGWAEHFRQLGLARAKQVVVFDIDDTLLANYPLMLENDFGWIPKLFKEFVEAANAPAINQTLGLYKTLTSELKYDVVFITGRGEADRQPTLKNLAAAGIVPASPDHLILRSADEANMLAVEYKSKRRLALVNAGYDIVGCIGDQVSDCAGGNAGYIGKCINYMYVIN
jgi:predicted secreted acid phosphatase